MQLYFILFANSLLIYDANMQVPAVYWWYKTSSHAAELTAGYYNPTNQDGYSPVFELLKKHFVIMKFVCTGLQVCSYESDEAFADPEGLSWQVIVFMMSYNLTTFKLHRSFLCYLLNSLEC